MRVYSVLVAALFFGTTSHCSAFAKRTSVFAEAKARADERHFHKRVAPPKRCLVSLFTNASQSDYAAGITTLAKSALMHGRTYFSDFVLIVQSDKSYDPAILNAARKSGWRLMNVSTIMPPRPSTFERFRDQFTKLHAWNMTQCDEVVYMDADTVFVNAATLFTTGETCKMWAARDFRAGKFVDTFNMGVFAIKPNASEYDRLVKLLQTDTVPYETEMSEQGFLNELYKDAWCELDFVKNANLATWWSFEQKEALQHMWDVRRLEIVHYTMSKPWACDPVYKPLCDMWTSITTSNTHPVTVVSAFFKGPAKHGYEKYAVWGEMFAQMAAPVVFFTDDEAMIRTVSKRHSSLTHVVNDDVSDFLVRSATYDWSKQLTADPEREIHSEHLFAVWLEKTNLVRKAIALNTFNSLYYVWIDFGAFRTHMYAPWTPLASAFPPLDKMLLLNVSTLSHDRTKLVGGTIFGGSVLSWSWWHTAFYATLHTRYRKGEFVGDDQTTMSIVADRWSDHVCVVQPSPQFGDSWFYLLAVLDGRAKGETRAHKVLGDATSC